MSYVTEDIVCKPLMEAAKADLYHKNPFRVIGMPVDTPLRDISKQADKLKMLLELGQENTIPHAVLPLAPPPTSHQVREAIENLKSPQNRLVYEFFWIWPEEFGKSGIDQAIQAWAIGDGETALKIWTLNEDLPQKAIVASHNLAVFWHLVALDWEKKLSVDMVDKEQAGIVEEYWQMSVKRWAALINNPEFWARTEKRIQQINDPRLPLSFGKSLQRDLPDALCKINLELALQHIEAGHRELANLHNNLLHAIISDSPRLYSILNYFFAPSVEYLQQQIKTVEQSIKTTPDFAGNTGKEMNHLALPLYELSKMLYGRDVFLNLDIFEKVAIASTNAAVAQYKAMEDHKAFVELLEQTLPMAYSPELRQRIEMNIAIGKANIQRDHFRPLRKFLGKIATSTSDPRSKLWRIRDSILPQIEAIPTLEKTSNPAVFELFDAVASTLLEIATDAVKQKDQDSVALSAIDLAIKFAYRIDLKKQLIAKREVIVSAIAEFQKTRTSSLHSQQLSALSQSIQNLASLNLPPLQQLVHLKESLLEKPPQEGWSEASMDAMATSLRIISINAFNEFGDLTTSQQAIDLAENCARNFNLSLQIKMDREQLRLIQTIPMHFSLNIRDITLEMTDYRLRIDKSVFPVATITGIRLGDRGKDRNFLIEIQTVDSKHYEVNCKPFLRNARKALEDLAQIRQALKEQVLPFICKRITRWVQSGSPYKLSANKSSRTESKNGIQITAENILIDLPNGKTDTIIPLAEATFLANVNGYYIKSKSAPIIDVTYIWNAPFLGEIITALKNAEAANPPSYVRPIFSKS